MCLHSDQGSNLNSEVITSLRKQLGIERTRTTAYHPQANGQVERFNRTLESMLSKVISENQKDWDIHLPKALFAYRTAIHESTGFTPFLVNYGRSATLPIDVMLGRTSLSSEGGREVPEYVWSKLDFHLEQHTTKFIKTLRKLTKPTNHDMIGKAQDVTLL